MDEVASRYGFSSLKKEQREVISSFLSGKDVFAVLPTGFGKSLCFALLPPIFDENREDEEKSIAIIITPLIAIIKDQVQAFNKKGFSAGYICGEPESDEEMRQSAEKGYFQLIYFTPEALLSSRKWRKILCSEIYQKKVVALVIDEAHTVIKWGKQFRESLLRIGEIRSLLPKNVNVIALTATAHTDLRKELAQVIGLINPVSIVLPPCRANIMYSVAHFANFTCNFKSFIDELKEKRSNFPRTIIYFRKMEDCANLYLYFQEKLGPDFTEPSGSPPLTRFRLVEMFTSCTDDDVKESIISLFTTQSSLRIVCATIAFGMGVDCPDVSNIIHIGPPDDTSSYIQETGRAGRDGRQAKAMLLFNKRLIKYADQDMKNYCNCFTICRRIQLFEKMEGFDKLLHTVPNSKCCDICAFVNLET